MGISAVARRRICGACAVSAIFVAAAVMAAPRAMAQGYFPRFYYDEPQPEAERGWTRRPQPRPRKPRKAYVRLDTGAPSAREVGRREVNNIERPLFVVVSIADQRVSLYNRNGLVDSSAISTGMAGHPTPTGLFTIIGRERYHASNIYSGAPMPFMQRITWSGIAMHLGVVPGHPASHGCIRLPAGFAVKLWGLTRIGERVVISPQDVTPSEFEHPLLPAPKMRAQSQADGAAPAQGSPQPPAAAQPPLVNPRQYAEQLKVKAQAEAAAARKAAKEASAALSLKQQEAARAEAGLDAAEAAHASARAKADAAAKAYEAASAAAAAKQQESVSAAELKPSDDALSRAKADRLSKAYEVATIAKDAAAIARTNADAKLAEAAAKLENSKTASAAEPAELADAVRRANEAAAASDAAAIAEKEAQRRMAPISVLISKKDRRIYVRQGLAPVFDAPASVRDPETPIGSHLYIATAVKDDGTSLKWSVVSMPVRMALERGGRAWKTASIDNQLGTPPRLHGSPSSPADALERVEVAQDVRDRIAERLWTGGSLIITDQPLSGETGDIGTDLTVKVR